MTPDDKQPQARVLVADDDAAARILLREALEGHGFAVSEARTGEEALQAFDAENPDLVVLDVVMPGIDGFETCKRLRARPRGQSTPVLLLTGLNDVESIQKAFDAGATDFASKPINWLVLAHRVRYMLRAEQTMDELRRSEAQVRFLAYYDGLTHLPNRVLFRDWLSAAMEGVGRSRVAVLIVDLDQFKRINETLGHAAGDHLIRAVASRIRASIGQGEEDPGARPRGFPELGRPRMVARAGADEFFVGLQGVDAIEAGRIGRQLLDALTVAFQVDGHEVYVTGSLGIAVYPDHGADVSTILRQADTALHEAKQTGWNSYEVASGAWDVKSAGRLTLYAQLRRALERQELEVHFQPQVDTARGAIVGLEALLRWRSAEMGLVSPRDFIPLAEESDLIVPIGDWVIQASCARIVEWRDRGCPVVVAVNLSARQLRKRGFPSRVAQILEETGADPERLELELTETILMQNVRETIQDLLELRRMGVRLSIDDFGTGYSSLAYLKRLPIDTLKIDQSFIRDIASDADDAAITTTVIAMAQRLDLGVVAEGVETEEQERFLTEHGCAVMQGWRFSRALPAGEILAVLERFGTAPPRPR